MPDLNDIAADPSWLPHAIDWQAQRMQFLRIERETLAEPGFLADRKPATQDEAAWLPLSQVASMDLPEGNLHFIFHTAFCRSTLLVRALNLPGTSAGLSEPGILAALANAGVQPGQPGAALVGPVLRLLARPWGEGEAVFVKPTNHANMLMPALLQAMLQARGVLMTNSLEAFLASVIRKGMMGRRWARQLYLEMQSYIGMDLGMDGREQFAMTDLQAAGLAWFLNQRWFTLHASGRILGVAADRLRVLDGDDFNAQRAHALMAVLQHCSGQAAPADLIAETIRGPVFARHSKLGGDFGDKEAADAARSGSAVNDEEIAQVAQWVGMIAQQAGIEVPVRQTLL